MRGYLTEKTVRTLSLKQTLGLAKGRTQGTLEFKTPVHQLSGGKSSRKPVAGKKSVHPRTVKIAIKVIDIFGNDTMRVKEVKI